MNLLLEMFLFHYGQGTPIQLGYKRPLTLNKAEVGDENDPPFINICFLISFTLYL